MQRINALLQKEWKDWVVDKLLGKGSYGTTYRAKRESYGFTEWAAIKHISIPAGETELNLIYEELATRDATTIRKYLSNQRTELLKEYEQMKNLPVHTNIVGCHDILCLEKEDGLGYDIFIRMELLESLTNRIMNGKMDRDQTIKLGIDLCNALILLQSKNIIHRDVKPQNIFVNESGDYKLGDFGTARSVLGSVSMMSIKGTVAYMPPEIMQRNKVSFTADIYSLGLVLYRLMNGNKSPFLLLDQSSTSTSIDEANNRRLDGEELPAPSDADQELAGIIMKACAYRPEDRWQSALEMRTALMDLQSGTVKKIRTTEERDQIQKDASQKEQEEKNKDRKKKEKEKEEIEQKKRRKLYTMIACAVALVVLAVGCILVGSAMNKSNQYKKAAQRYENGDLESALAGYSELGSYRDAEEMVDKINSEIEKAQKYAAAEAEYNNRNYDQARTMFSNLKGFKDADAWVEKLDTMSAQYEDANEKVRYAKYEDALQIYKVLAKDNYKDSATRRDEIQKFVDYRLAEAYERQGNLAEALNLYNGLAAENFKDAAARKDKIQKEIDSKARYETAIEYEKNKNYEQAREIYVTITDYMDSAARAAEMDKYILYELGVEAFTLGDYVTARSIFINLTGFEYADDYLKNAEAAIEAQGKEAIYTEALLLAENKEYEAAYERFVLLGKYEQAAIKAAEMEKYIKYGEGIELYENQEYDDALLIFEELGNFEQAKEYIDLTQKAIDLEQEYSKAVSQEEKGYYKSAKRIYDELGDYKDAAAKAAEMQQFLDYQQAEEHVRAGEYQQAIDLYKALESFENSEILLKRAERELKAQQNSSTYKQAQGYESQKKYREALDLYVSLGEYQDASQRALKMRQYLDYETALGLLNSGSFEAAIDIFELLEGFLDSDQMIETAQYSITQRDAYQAADNLAQSGDYQAAKDAFIALGRYQDASDKAALMQRYLEYQQAISLNEQGKYEAALKIFSELGEFEEAVKYTATVRQSIEHRDNYAKAQELENKEQYKEALDLLKSLGNYKDAAEKAAALTAKIAWIRTAQKQEDGSYVSLVNGANLLSGSLAEREAQNGAVIVPVAQALAPYDNQDERPITISFDAKTMGKEPCTIIVEAYNNSGVSVKDACTFKIPAGRYERFAYTTAIVTRAVNAAGSDAALNAGALSFRAVDGEGKPFSIKRIKIEIGDKNTAWSFAESDPLVTRENLLINSAQERTTSDGLIVVPVREALQEHVNLPLMVSFEAKSNGSNPQTIRVYPYQNSGISIGKDAEFALTDQYKRYVFETTVQDYLYQRDAYTGTMLSSGALAFFDAAAEKQPFSVRNIKLEIGSKATAWTLAPKDPLITGENLLVNGAKAKYSANGWVGISVANALKPFADTGVPICISFEAKMRGNKDKEISVYAYQESGVSIAAPQSVTLHADRFERFSIVTTAHDFGVKYSDNMGTLGFMDESREDEFVIRKVKIEIGYKPTSFSFAPGEDYGEGINLLSGYGNEITPQGGLLTIPVAEVFKSFEGMPVSVSFEAKALSAEPQKIRVYGYQESGISIDNSTVLEIVPEGFRKFHLQANVVNHGAKRDPQTGKVLTDGAIAFYNLTNDKQPFEIRHVKLEIGTRQTGYTLSPEDPVLTGENLLIGFGAERRTNLVNVPVGDILKNHVGLPVTISFEAKSNLNGDCMIFVEDLTKTGVSIENAAVFTASTAAYQRFSFTAMVHDYAKAKADSGVVAIYSADRSEAAFSIRKIKVEIGETATDWYFAPNDPALSGDNLLVGGAKAMSSAKSQIVVVSVKDALEKYIGLPVTISFEASSDSENPNPVRVYAYQESGVSIASNYEFTPPVGSFKRFSFTTTVADFGRRVANGKLMSDGSIAFFDYAAQQQPFTIRKVKIEIGKKATGFTFATNDPLISGKNLLANYGMEKVVDTGLLAVPVRTALEEFVGLPVTISFEAKSNCDQPQSVKVYAYQDSGITIQDAAVFTFPPNEYKAFSFQTTVTHLGFKRNQSNGSSLTDGALAFFNLNEREPGSYSIRRLKIEIGSVEKPQWKLAPNDQLITGENLLPDGRERRTSVNGRLLVNVRETLEKYIGIPVAISFNAVLNSNSASATGELTLSAYEDSGISIGEPYTFTIGKYQKRYTLMTTVKNYTFKVDQKTGKNYSDGQILFSCNGNDFVISQIKIEIGYNSTLWTEYVAPPAENQPAIEAPAQ